MFEYLGGWMFDVEREKHWNGVEVVDHPRYEACTKYVIWQNILINSVHHDHIPNILMVITGSGTFSTRNVQKKQSWIRSYRPICLGLLFGLQRHQVSFQIDGTLIVSIHQPLAPGILWWRTYDTSTTAHRPPLTTPVASWSTGSKSFWVTTDAPHALPAAVAIPG